MNQLQSMIEFLATSTNWQGSEGILSRWLTHLWVSGLAVLAALILAVPIGIGLGHLRRGRIVAVAVANLARAIPSLAILALVVALGWGIGFTPTWVAMLALAIPPIFVGSLIGVSEIDESVRDAAAGLGLSAWQTIRAVEIPLCLPLLLSGVRVAASQVIATATLGAFVGYNTLGRFITVGRANRDDGMLYAGVLIIVVTAVAADLLLRIAIRRVTAWRAPQGVS